MTLAALPPEAYLWFKTLHIVGVVVWFAGLFYLVRLFIYHREAEELAPELRTAFQARCALVERRLAPTTALWLGRLEPLGQCGHRIQYESGQPVARHVGTPLQPPLSLT